MRQKRTAFLGTDDPSRLPWELAAFCILATVIPGYLKWNNLLGKTSFLGYPPQLLGFIFFVLVVFAFTVPLLEQTSQGGKKGNPGVAVLIGFLLIMAVVWGMGLTHLGTQAQEQAKNSALYKWIPPVGLGIYTIKNVKTSRDRSVILGSLLAGITYSSVVALVQSALHIDYSEALTQHLLVGTYPVSGGERVGVTRTHGTFPHPIPFAAATAAVFPLAIHFSLFSATTFRRVIAGCSAATLLFAIPTSVSRTGLIALAVALLTYSRPFRFRQMGFAIVMLTALFALFLVVMPHTANALYQTVINSGNDTSITIRLAQQDSAKAIFAKFPAFGEGLGSHTLDVYGTVPVDNQWWTILSQAGVVGALAVLLLIVGGAVGFHSAIHRAKSVKEKSEVYAVAAIFISLLSGGTSYDIFDPPQIQLIFFLTFGVGWSYYALNRYSSRENDFPELRRVPQ